METAIIIAAETYANLHGKITTQQVLNEMAAGNQIIIESVLTLMEVTA